MKTSPFRRRRSAAASKRPATVWRCVPNGAPAPSPAGKKQRLITASALATEQKILLLDEPLANLDRKGAAFLMSSLRTLAESGYAVLLVEHRLEQVLPFAHEVWRLRNGSLERQTRPGGALRPPSRRRLSLSPQRQGGRSRS